VKESPIFQVDFSPSDDPHDLGLCYLSVSPIPLLSTACYLQASQIENCAHLISQFVLNPNKSATRFTFNRFEKIFAGGAVDLQLFRHGTMAKLHLALITRSAKDADVPATLVQGEVSLEDVATFAESMKEINAGLATSAFLRFAIA
jgi:hypothetical protein